MINIFIGGYTKRNGQGIYHLTLSSGRLSVAEPVADIANPTWLSADVINGLLYSNGTTETGYALRCFRVLDDGKLEMVSESASTYTNPCHFAMDKDRERIYSTAYHDGVLEYRTYDKVTGHLFDVEAAIKLKGSGPVKPRQDASHPHMAFPYGAHLYVCDLGSDSVLIFDRKSLHLTARVPLEPGSGPRHIAFNGPKAYVVSELSNKLILLNYDVTTGLLTPIRYYSTVPKSYEGENLAAAIRLHPERHTLYVSNRGHDSITVYHLNEDGEPTGVIQNIRSGGHWCRDFNITADGRYLIAAHERSDNVTLYTIASDGRLEMISHDTVVPEGTSVVIYE
ncbi:MAG: lactonase family protein [Eubacteriales bacterium]|nr:lactonase family protein [Eubacteriales bacterium]